MQFFQGKKKELFLLTNEVETIFLHEYMPGAPGDHVKVYLFGLMYAQLEEPLDHQTLAKQLRLPEEAVHQAWSYWADRGVIKKHPRQEKSLTAYDVEFLSLRDQLYGRQPKEAEAPAEKGLPKAMENTAVKTLLADIEQVFGRMLSSKEMEDIYKWTGDLQASPELILFAVEYCHERGKNNLRYIEKVIYQWRMTQGFQTVEEVKAYLSSLEERMAIYKRVLQALGMNRGATEGEKELINAWLDDMHFNMERILEACNRTTIPNPSVRYVNKILENWYNEAQKEGRDVNKKVTVTQTVLNQYYEYIREKEETAAEARKEEIYLKLPRIQEIDKQLTVLGSEMSRSLLSGGKRANVQETRDAMQSLEAERAVLLTESNYPMDYTDRRYLCEHCRDTGVTEDGRRCDCTRKRIEEAELWQKTN